MKKIITFVALSLAVAFGVTSCNNNQIVAEGKGEFSLRVFFDDATRATAAELAENCTINIYNSEGLLRTYQGIGSVPSKMWLVAGDYRCDILAGTESAASFTDKTYKGSQAFTITADRTTTVSVDCRVNNVVAAVVFKK